MHKLVAVYFRLEVSVTNKENALFIVKQNEIINNCNERIIR